MGVTGEAIADCLIQHLTGWQLPASRLCGQSYDGAGAMAGKTKEQPHELPSNTLKLCTHTVQHMFLTSVLLSVVVSPKFVTPWTLVIESVVSSHFLRRDNLLLSIVWKKCWTVRKGGD